LSSNLSIIINNITSKLEKQQQQIRNKREKLRNEKYLHLKETNQ